MVERGEVVSLFSDPFTDYTRDLLAAVPRLPAAGSGVEPAPEHEPVSSAGPRWSPPVLSFDAVDIDYPGRFGRPAIRALHRISSTSPPEPCSGWSASPVPARPRWLGPRSATWPRPRAASCWPAASSAADSTRLRRIRSRLGMVHQDPASTLDPLLTVGESIAEPLLVHRAASGAELRSRVRVLLDEVALPAEFDTGCRTSCPADNVNGSRWPGRSPSGRSC